ncbi:hypothetical protein GCM10027598_81160 [Amycolatopsis oliviviridis]|uniref:GAF domain-containing protein n=1 Tax=Amycolatopsis oliviviridis TaxID=1471590 RepID=A0ABQ3LEJ6_9PSEU|nr:hypothetical protein [Amycolatopsis oliviviridis]GHH06141.1 hypothetical protein GCM10017790_11050 [Amycolatopsis oliviviridis]
MLFSRLTKVIVSALSVAITTMAQLNLPNAGFWPDRRPVLYLAIAGLVTIAGIELFGTVVDRLQLPRVRGFEQELRAVLSAGISQLAHHSPAAWREIGVSAYQIRGLRWSRRLVLVDSLRLGTGPKVGVRWRPGLGVIGTAYQQQDLLSVDWESYFKSAESAGPTAWQARTELDRFGLSWGELMRTKALVGVTACPVYGENGDLIGVVCADAPTDLSSQQVGATMRDIANAVGDLGTPPASWWSYVGRRVA